MVTKCTVHIDITDVSTPVLEGKGLSSNKLVY